MLDYVSEVLRDRPVEFWPCDQVLGASQWNLVPGSSHADVLGAVEVGRDWRGPSLFRGVLAPRYNWSSGNTGHLLPDDRTFPGAMTAECWIRTPGSGVILAPSRVDGAFFARWDGLGWMLWTNGSNVTFGNDNAAGAQWVAGTTRLADGRIHHLAVTRAGGSGSVARIYFDGVEVASGTTGTLTEGAGSTGSNRLLVGAYNYAFINGHLRAQYGMVAFYDRALSAARIRRHYLAGHTRGGLVVARAHALHRGRLLTPRVVA